MIFQSDMKFLFYMNLSIFPNFFMVYSESLLD